MATKKISELNALTTPESDDLIAIVDASATETKKITYGNISKHIVNVGTEVEEDTRVNFIKSKNLLSTSLELGTYSNEGVKSGSTANYRNVNAIKVKPNTTYTFSINGTAHAYALYFYTSSRVFISSTTTSTFTTPANCEYLNFRCFNADFTSDFANLKIQIEEGNTATSYEPYTPPSINVDGETIVNKNVYSSNEVVIGEWFGKPLYRKVIEVNTPTLDAWTNVNHNISNIDFGRIVDATLTRTIYGTTSYIPIGVSNISAGTLFTCDLQKTIIEYKIAGYTNITKLIAVLEYTKSTD